MTREPNNNTSPLTPSVSLELGDGVLVDILLLTLLFFVIAGWPSPDVNEAHYLAKAKHYWNPEWCGGDLFLDSTDAHLVFYWTFGWITRWVSFPVAAWIGRFLTWGLLAWSWTLLSRAVIPRRLWALLSGALFCALTARFHMAGEWIIGGVEAKTFAYAFVLFGVRQVLLGRWGRAGLFFGVAAAFHVLVGGWAWIAAAFAWTLCGHRDESVWRMAPWWFGGLAVASVGIAPLLMLPANATGDEQLLANQIYVYERLSHHLAFHRFSHVFMGRFAALSCLWGVAAWQLRAGEHRRVHAFVLGSLAIAACGVVIDQSLLTNLPLAASLLRFYWYRLADIAVPLGAALCVLYYFERQRIKGVESRSLWLAAVLLAPTAHVLDIQIDRRRDFSPASIRQPMQSARFSAGKLQDWSQDWRAVCRWIRDNTPENARFLTPRRQQTFKWYAHRGEVCNWKDVPQDAKALIAWHSQFRQIYRRGKRGAGLSGLGETRLNSLAQEHGAQFVVIDLTLPNAVPLSLPQVYPNRTVANASFAVYRLAPASKETPTPQGAAR